MASEPQQQAADKAEGEQDLAQQQLMRKMAVKMVQVSPIEQKRGQL